jgi:hypothetical protein
MPPTLQQSQGTRFTPDSDAGPMRRPRATRGFHVAIAALMTFFVIAGFWPYFGRLLAGVVTQTPRIIHLHAVVFSGWMVLLVVQVTLVHRRRTALHRQVGRLGIAYGTLVLIMGLVASLAAPVLHVSSGEWTRDQAAAFLIVPLGDMVLFAALFGGAIAYRRKPEVHKRLILLATIALLFAPAGRLSGRIPILNGHGMLLLLWLWPLAIAMGYDLWSRRRIHTTYLIGMVILLIGFSRVLVARSEAWLTIGRAILGAITPA